VIQVFACNGTAAQSWAWSSDDGTLRALNKCLDVTGGATANGTPLQLWDCNGTGAQERRWRQQTRLVNPQSGRCLALVGGSAPDGASSRSQTVTTLRVRFGGCPEVGRSKAEFGKDRVCVFAQTRNGVEARLPSVAGDRLQGRERPRRASPLGATGHAPQVGDETRDPPCH
jgi:hypothetical protein